MDTPKADNKIVRISRLLGKYEGFIEILVIDVFILVFLVFAKNGFLKYVAAQLLLGFIPGNLCLCSLKDRIGKLQYYVLAFVSGLFFSLFLISIFYLLDLRSMFFLYIAVILVTYNIFNGIQAYRRKERLQNQPSPLTVKIDRASPLLILLLMFVIVLNISTFHDQYSVSDDQVNIISSDLSYLTDVSLAGTYSLEHSKDYLKFSIHYLESLSVHLFKKLTHLPIMQIMKYNFFFFIILPALLLLFIVNVLTDGNKWAIFLSLMIFLFDTGITTSLVGLFGGAPHLFDGWRFHYASTLNFKYLSNTTSLMARYLIFAILYLVIVVHKYLTKKKFKSNIIILLYLSVLIASSYVTKFSLYIPLMILLTALLLLDLLRKRKNTNIIILFSLSLGLSFPHLIRIFTSELSNRIVFSPVWFLGQSRRIFLAQCDFFRAIPEPYLSWIILLILLSSAWYLLLPISYSFKDWLKKDSLFSSFFIASAAAISIPFLFVDAMYPFHRNVFLFSQTGFQIFAIIIPVWLFSKTNKLRSQLIRRILIIPFVLSCFYGFQQFVQFRENNFITLTRAQLADKMHTFPDRIILIPEGIKTKYRTKDRMDVDNFLYESKNRLSYEEIVIHEFTRANSRWIKTQRGMLGVDHIFFLQKKGTRSLQKKRKSDRFLVKSNTQYTIVTEVRHLSRIAFDLRIAFYGKEGKIGSQTLYFSPYYDKIHHYFRSPVGTKYLKLEVEFKSLKSKSLLKKSKKHLRNTRKHVQFIEKIKINELDA